MKKLITVLLIIILIGLGIWLFVRNSSESTDLMEDQDSMMEDGENMTEGDSMSEDSMMEDETETVIGHSASGRGITAYHYGSGDDELLFVGGIHGGYSWNTVLVARELMDYLEENESIIPENVKVTVVPLLNPDGLSKVVENVDEFSSSDVATSESVLESGRFNGNNVDLNRNFDCDWQSTGTWQDKSVDGGDSALSEPESQAISKYINKNNPDAVVVWYSSAGGVFASSCHNGILDETREITNIYADASGYPAYEEFNFYEITGDMVNWLAKNDVPAISILLTDHQSVEWDKNKKGIDALLDYYSK